MIKKELSIIVVIKNRTIINVSYNGKDYKLSLFANNLDCLFKLIQDDEKWELIVVDFSSSDVDMKEYLQYMFRSYNKPNFTCELIQVNDEHFNKGKGLNIGGNAAKYETLFFLDADMKLTDRIMIDTAYTQTQLNNKVYFPVCLNYENPEHSHVTQRPSGKGNVFISKTNFALKSWPEYNQWGLEDDHFYDYYDRIKMIFRDCPGTFYHQWHPNDVNFKNRYYKGKK